MRKLRHKFLIGVRSRLWYLHTDTNLVLMWCSNAVLTRVLVLKCMLVFVLLLMPEHENANAMYGTAYGDTTRAVV